MKIKIIFLLCCIALFLCGCSSERARERFLEETERRKEEASSLMVELKPVIPVPDYSERYAYDHRYDPPELPRATAEYLPGDIYMPKDECMTDMTFVQVNEEVEEAIDYKSEEMKELLDQYVDDNSEVYGHPFCIFLTSYQISDEEVIMTYRVTTTENVIRLSYNKEKKQFEVRDGT